MIDKIYFTKDDSLFNVPQLHFEMPVGYKLYAIEEVVVDCIHPHSVNFGVRVFSEQPSTVIYSPAIHSDDFRIVDPVQMLAPQRAALLNFAVVNPKRGDQPWCIHQGSLIATMVVVQTYAVNLFEVSNKVFERYV